MKIFGYVSEPKSKVCIKKVFINKKQQISQKGNCGYILLVLYFDAVGLFKELYTFNTEC
jgi:hypothetical protein